MISANASLVRAVYVLMAHVVKYKTIIGHWPNHLYLMVAFDVSYEFADHVLTIADLIIGDKEIQA